MEGIEKQDCLIYWSAFREEKKINDIKPRKKNLSEVFKMKN